MFQQVLDAKVTKYANFEKKNNRQIEGTFGRLSQYVNTLSRFFFVVFRNQNMMGHPEHILIEQTTIFIFFFHP